MLLKLKLFITSLVNLGAFPFIALSLYDIGYIYAEYLSLIWLIIFAELIFGTLLLMSIVYADASVKKTTIDKQLNHSDPHIHLNNECVPTK
ncbi:MAG: hypothetical protein ACTSR8_08060 [Promethearchaeota archaeon]